MAGRRHRRLTSLGRVSDLPPPRTQEGAAALAAVHSSPGDALVALDFDGTLSPIVANPEEAFAHEAAPAALARLAAVVGTVAVVTGRPVTEAVRLGRLAGVPGIVVLGHYGMERYEDGSVETPESHDGVERLRPRLAELAHDGVRLEDKGHSLALHTRGAADPQGSLERLRDPVEALATEVGLEVVPGRFVLEVRPPGVDKGGALRSLVAERGATAVLFAGDDLGDLPAVRTVHELREEGVPGLVVCSDSAETPAALRDQADVLVDGPQGVVDLLASLADSLSG